MKKGFTLAEILITMGIIGVVAALAAPALIAGSSKAKIGPTLSKAVSTFESAAELLLHEEETSSLVSVAGQGHHSGINLGRALSKYMKLDDVTGSDMLKHTHMGNYYDYQKNGFRSTWATSQHSAFLTDDGALYFITNLNKRTPIAKYQDIENNQAIGELYIDINGPHKPNTVAKDLFRFVLYNDGTLRPYGSKNNYQRNTNPAHHWDNTKGGPSDFACSSQSVHTGWSCTGSIFDNNMKVIYK